MFKITWALKSTLDVVMPRKNAEHLVNNAIWVLVWVKIWLSDFEMPLNIKEDIDLLQKNLHEGL